MIEFHKIIIITCWYGKYPWYLPYYLHSCIYNPTIDFVIITDNSDEILNLPKNVKIIFKNLYDIITETSEKLKFTINIDYPYKLCDFKPAYGFMFPELVKGYDFWGHSDLDLIYGDIRSFLTYSILENYDYLSVRHDYTTGCFGLYRNNNFVNNFFQKSKDYKRVFSDSKHYCFDECNFAWDYLVEGTSIFDVETEIESFTHLMKKAEVEGILRTHFDFILMEGYVGYLKFDKGKIIYRNKYEAIMYHLFWLKKIFSPKKQPKYIPETYYISSKKIYFKKLK